MCVIGHGVVAYLPGLFEEIEKLEAAGVSTEGRIMLSDRAHLLFQLHREVSLRRSSVLAPLRAIRVTRRCSPSRHPRGRNFRVWSGSRSAHAAPIRQGLDTDIKRLIRPFPTRELSLRPRRIRHLSKYLGGIW
eukprot:8577023-Pyramimonas_sp.AAC.1